VFSKTVFSIARSTLRMYSVMAMFKSSVVCTVIVRCRDTFWSPCIYAFCWYIKHKIARHSGSALLYGNVFVLTIQAWRFKHDWKYAFHNDQPACGVSPGQSKISSLCLGAFTKLRKATISFIKSVRLLARTEQLVSHWKDFHEILCLKILLKFVGKI
jgi:hypothetical protein